MKLIKLNKLNRKGKGKRGRNYSVRMCDGHLMCRELMGFQEPGGQSFFRNALRAFAYDAHLIFDAGGADSTLRFFLARYARSCAQALD